MGVLNIAKRLANRWNQKGQGNVDAFDEDDPFWNYYNQLEPGYQAQLQPYLHGNYSPGWRDTIRGALGMRSNADAYLETLRANAWTQLGNLSQDQFANNWNSEQSTTARLSNAGVNPDLTGEVDGDPASGAEQPTTPPVVDFLTPPSCFSIDLSSLFQDASALISAATGFEGMLATRGLQKIQGSLAETEAAKNRISSYSTARDYVDRMLKGMNPDDWKNYFDESGEFQAGIMSADYKKFFGDVDPSISKYIEQAFNSALSDPSLMRQYYDNAVEASKGAVTYNAANKVYGSPDLPNWLVSIRSSRAIDWSMKSMERMLQYQAKQSRLMNIEADNSIALAEFAQENNLPIEMGKAQLQQAIAQQAQAKQDQFVLEAEKEWLEDMQKMRRSNDKEKRDIANYLIQAYFARQAASLRQSAFGFGGNIGIGDFNAGFNFNRNRTAPLATD